jgi:hypothetical protein
LQLIPYVGQEPMRSDSFSIVVSEEDRHRVTRLLMRCRGVTSVNDKDSLAQAEVAAGQLKALINEIDDAKKAAKRPFSAVEQTIENKAQEISEGLRIENKRILSLMNAHVAQLEAQAKAEQRKREEALRIEKARLEKIAAEARAQQLKAEAEARAAQDEAERLRAQIRAKQMEEARQDAELDQVLAAEVANLGVKPQPSLLRGGRVDHPWKFRLVDVEAVVKAGYTRCLRIEPDILACRDAVKAQLERRGPDATPSIPGFEISRETSVSIRASA